LYKGEKGMNKNPLIGVSIIAVVLLILATLTNVVGYQTVQTSNQKTINSEVDQQDLLFQTIVDITNNKEIQRIILKSQINRDGFLNPELRYSIFNTPILTKNQLKNMYLVGLMLSKTISKSKMHLLLERYQVNNQWMQKEIIAIIEKEDTINRELTQLSTSKCNCENNTGVTSWPFPIICSIAGFLVLIGVFLALTIGSGDILLNIAGTLIKVFNCPGWS
jgi:hypothetical protein